LWNERKVQPMTDKEALRQIEKEEGRFMAANCSRGKMLAKSARDYFRQLKDAEKRFASVEAKYKADRISLAKVDAMVKAAEELIRQKSMEVKRLRGEMVRLRTSIKSGDRVLSKVNVARIRMIEKVKALKTMKAE